MNGAHWHLVLNHMPIIFPMVGLIVLIVAIMVKSSVMERTAYFIFILGALATIPAFLTGEGAEEVAEGLPGVTENLIGIHEEMAETFAVFSYALGFLSLVTLYLSWKSSSFANWLKWLIVPLCVVTLYFGRTTGTSGGEIRHTEIRSGAPVTSGGTNQGGSESEDD
ncbi:MAG: hypothetical protein IPN29_05450 [Saprospiraceae bacterium]|nr:hypothetical protein [Saprospiraceae bacterium]